MNGIPKSEVDPIDLIEYNYNSGNSDVSKLVTALGEPEYLIALLQKALYNTARYNPEHSRWDNVTPEQYRQKMNSILQSLEDKVYEVLKEHEAELLKAFPKVEK